MMDVRIGWASFDAAAAPLDVRVGWVEFDATARPLQVRVGWVEFDARVPVAPPAPPVDRPKGGGAGYHPKYSYEQHIIPIDLGDATEAEEEEIILALLMEIATYVV